ncbi:GGDEF domain-containing protein [Bacillus sp. 31A1R]|uniref:GGDEF domain-containing protein n=1 Tax=Robertmurraya mangrovi TaxID=3098077 RepID=A0ABU5IYQ0_9BACI|nr:GGDEF domain-containing protein [Bacillus sp. 31A1R]MDZ5472309.1 GGDEF domain-containing protein [Bacillus sp. 31A1R]
MKKEFVYKVLLFLLVIMIAFFGDRVELDTKNIFLALLLFILFSIVNYHLSIQSELKGVNTAYAINYGIAVAIYTGPIGLLLYEIVHNLLILFMNIWKKRANDRPYLYTFYNITTFSAANLVAYYLYLFLWPELSSIPFGFWITFTIIAVVSTFTSDTIMLVYFWLIKEIRTLKDGIQFYHYWNLFDIGKTILANGLLFVFLQQQQWQYLIGLMVLNYFVNHSIIMKTKNLQDKMERDQFEVLAYKDALTEIHNRAFMDKKIKELSLLGETMGIVVADIDRFKMINDTYNHAIGDEVLRHYANYLKSFLKEDDFLFRSGGEEFTLFLRNRTYEEAYELLEQLRQELEKESVEVDFNGMEHNITYTSSFGLFYHTFSGPLTIEKGYIQADNLLFQSKRLGRNRITGENGLV